MRRLSVVAAVAMLAVGGGQAGAAVLTSTFTGTVLSGTDGPGDFGPAGGDLTGDPYSITYTFNDTLGVRNPGQLYGGTNQGTSSPLTQVAFTINGMTSVFSSFPTSSQLNASLLLKHGKVTKFAAFSSGLNGGQYAMNQVVASPAHGSYTVVGDEYSGALNSSKYCFDSSHTNNCGQFFLPGGLHGQFLTTTFDIVGMRPVGEGVPEPGTWAVLLLGLGAIGWRTRRSRAAAA